MTVVTLNACPQSLRGDLTLWLQEINTGTFVGTVNARVRDLLWQRILECIGNGRATMVYTARNEQGMEYRIHNGSWQVEDYDGIKLVKRPPSGDAKQSDSKVNIPSETQTVQKIISYPMKYVVVDLETTGLRADNERIIEVGALKVENGIVQETMNCLIKIDRKIPELIMNMTGITDEMLENGIDAKEAMMELITFMKGYPMVAHNVAFDLNFLKATCEREKVRWEPVQSIDTIEIAKVKHPNMTSYKLEKLLEHFSLPHEKLHRALNDCFAVHALYGKLNENDT